MQRSILRSLAVLLRGPRTKRTEGRRGRKSVESRNYRPPSLPVEAVKRKGTRLRKTVASFNRIDDE